MIINLIMAYTFRNINDEKWIAVPKVIESTGGSDDVQLQRTVEKVKEVIAKKSEEVFEFNKAPAVKPDMENTVKNANPTNVAPDTAIDNINFIPLVVNSNNIQSKTIQLEEKTIVLLKSTPIPMNSVDSAQSKRSRALEPVCDNNIIDDIMYLSPKNKSLFNCNGSKKITCLGCTLV